MLSQNKNFVFAVRVKTDPFRQRCEHLHVEDWGTDLPRGSCSQLSVSLPSGRRHIAGRPPIVKGLLLWVRYVSVAP